MYDRCIFELTRRIALPDAQRARLCSEKYWIRLTQLFQFAICKRWINYSLGLSIPASLFFFSRPLPSIVIPFIVAVPTAIRIGRPSMLHRGLIYQERWCLAVRLAHRMPGDFIINKHNAREGYKLGNLDGSRHRFNMFVFSSFSFYLETNLDS